MNFTKGSCPGTLAESELQSTELRTKQNTWSHRSEHIHSQAHTGSCKSTTSTKCVLRQMPSSGSAFISIGVRSNFRRTCSSGNASTPLSRDAVYHKRKSKNFLSWFRAGTSSPCQQLSLHILVLRVTYPQQQTPTSPSPRGHPKFLSHPRKSCARSWRCPFIGSPLLPSHMELLESPRLCSLDPTTWTSLSSFTASAALVRSIFS
jgi:hypothetical protein